MRRKVDRLLDLLVLIGYSIEFPVKLAKRISGHEQYDRIVMYRALREGYAELLRREGKRQVIRSLRLTEKGFDYIAGRDPEALGIIYSRIGAAPPVYPSKESRILRLHAIAVGLVMARMAGAVISPLEKPPLLLSSRGLWYPQAEPEKVYYYAPFELRAAFEEVDDRVVSKTSRLIGVLVHRNCCYCLYFAGNTRMFWQQLSEENHATAVRLLLAARGFPVDTISQIVIGNRMEVSKRLCHSPGPRKYNYFVASEFFANCFFLSNDGEGDRLLSMMLQPAEYLPFTRQALVGYRPPRSGMRVFDAEEADTGRPVILACCCDLLVMEQLRLGFYDFLDKPIVLCFEHQREVLQNLLDDAAEVRSVSEEAYRSFLELSLPLTEEA